ncbi:MULTISPECIES: hypothetical protein [Clostridium]|uniref:hypothetical protein n=1 Tax=Clostridium TaxID=1485 RepID=UPI00189B56FD|nr:MULTISPECIES: hypothetical protein [Clostridium]MCR1949781.1 hypothetical protein [Clostridium sp. DSM 100503]MDI9215903.1 hypothetical protein [Clostridium tertium]
MNHLKNFIKKINNDDLEEDRIDEITLKCKYCNKAINIKDSYIDKEDLNIYCSKKCFIENLNCKYF